MSNIANNSKRKKRKGHLKKATLINILSALLICTSHLLPKYNILSLSHRVRSTGRRDFLLSSQSPPLRAITEGGMNYSLKGFPKLKLANQSYFSFQHTWYKTDSCLDNTFHYNVVCWDFLNVVFSVFIYYTVCLQFR